MNNHVSAAHSIRQRRIALGWSQKDLADRLETTKATVSKIERATMKVSEEWLDRFAKAFGVTPGELLGEVVVSRLDGAVSEVPIIDKSAANGWVEALKRPVGHILVVHAGYDAFAIKPDDDSVNLLVPEGANVVVEPQDTELRDGKLYAILHEDARIALRVFHIEPARLEPCSTNPSHQTIVVGRDPFSVLGRVAQVIHRV